MIPTLMTTETDDFPYGEPTYEAARLVVLGHTDPEGAAAVVRALVQAMRAAYSIGREEERRQAVGGTVVLATLQELPSCPCCCTHPQHCEACHGAGHAEPSLSLPQTALDGATQLIPRVPVP